jgi:hypothetical protein
VEETEGPGEKHSFICRLDYIYGKIVYYGPCLSTYRYLYSNECVQCYQNVVLIFICKPHTCLSLLFYKTSFRRHIYLMICFNLIVAVIYLRLYTRICFIVFHVNKRFKYIIMHFLWFAYSHLQWKVVILEASQAICVTFPNVFFGSIKLVYPPPLFTEVPVPSQKSERPYICVLEVSILSHSTNFDIWSCVCSDSVVFFTGTRR